MTRFAFWGWKRTKADVEKSSIPNLPHPHQMNVNSRACKTWEFPTFKVFTTNNHHLHDHHHPHNDDDDDHLHVNSVACKEIVASRDSKTKIIITVIIWILIVVIIITTAICMLIVWLANDENCGQGRQNLGRGTCWCCNYHLHHCSVEAYSWIILKLYFILCLTWNHQKTLLLSLTVLKKWLRLGMSIILDHHGCHCNDAQSSSPSPAWSSWPSSWG